MDGETPLHNLPCSPTASLPTIDLCQLCCHGTEEFTSNFRDPVV